MASVLEVRHIFRFSSNGERRKNQGMAGRFENTFSFQRRSGLCIRHNTDAFVGLRTT